MDFQRALNYYLDDPDWMKKLAIGLLMALLSFLILPMFIMVGYGVRIARNVKDGLDVPLPEWDDWGGMLSEGFAVCAAGFLYSLPIVVLSIIGVLLISLGDSSNSDALAAMGGVSFMVLICIASLYFIALFAIMPAIYVQYINHGSLSACLQYRKVFGITRQYIGDILMTLLMMFGVFVAVSMLSFIPCLGQLISLVASPWIGWVMAHLYGQIAAKASGNKGDKFDEMGFDQV